MKLLSEIFSGIVKKIKSKNNKAHYIFYKIIASKEDHYFLLQCRNTKATFYSTLSEIVFDTDILYGLHPIQACFIGIEYSKYIKNKNSSLTSRNREKENLKKYSIHRYGNYILLFQNREGKVGFINGITNEEFMMDPRDIALTEELIQEFDAAQAFYIGLLAGLKSENPTKKQSVGNKYQKLNLRIIK